MWVDRQIHLLPLPDGFTGGTVRDINDSGVGVGHVWNDDGVNSVTRWRTPHRAAAARTASTTA